MNKKLIAVCLLVFFASICYPVLACQSPEGEWVSQDEYGELKLIFNKNGTGQFFPDPNINEFEKIEWKFISPMKRKSTEPNEFNVETNVIEIRYSPPDGQYEYILCTGWKMVVQIYSLGEFINYSYEKSQP